MAKQNANARNTRNTKPASRGGRKTNAQRNAERLEAAQSQAMHLVEVATAAYASGMKTALGLDTGVAGTVTTIGAATGQSATQSQGSQSAPAQTTSRKRQAPGRRQDPESKMSLTRDFYAENLKAANPLTRAELVKAAAKKFGYTPQTGNTYISKIDNENGRKLARRRTSSNGRSRGNQTGGSQRNGTNG